MTNLSCFDAIKEIYGVEEVSEKECESFLSVLKDLSDREERVFRLYYGVDDGHKRSLEEVSNEFGVTREKVIQVVAGAIKKLRHPTRSKVVIGEAKWN